MIHEEKAYLAALSSISGFGCKTVTSLVDSFGSAYAVWTAPEQALRNKNIPAPVLDRLLAHRKTFDAERYFETLLEKGIGLLSLFDDEYPDCLKAIYNPPVVLYVKGTFPNINTGVAVVGTRRATVYGTKAAFRIAGELARNNICVISGMARGIDTWAHKGALAAKGKTIAVLGCGVDIVYPPENVSLAEQIQESGAVISEFPLGRPPDKANFPARNRIISGLSKGVVVVEAPVRSGALITADFALEQGREVFAVPGPINSRNSEGCHLLIKEGARLLHNVEDVLDELGCYSEDSNKLKGSDTVETDLTPKVKEILRFLAGGPVLVDELCVYAGMSPGDLNVLITIMELEGLVVKSAGKVMAADHK